MCHDMGLFGVALDTIINRDESHICIGNPPHKSITEMSKYGNVVA